MTETAVADTFEWDGASLGYLDHPYNTTALNERAIEIPIAWWWLSKRTGEGLEVGNVLSHYGPTRWRIVDLYERVTGVDNIDVFEIRGAYDWILSVSTLEHVRWDHAPKDPDAAVAAVNHLRSLLRPKGSMLLTVPMGHHPRLDSEIVTGRIGAAKASVYVRGELGWEPARLGTWRRYGPRWANAVWIGELRGPT